MLVQEIQGTDYVVKYDADSGIVVFQGEISLKNPKEYKPILTLLQDVAKAGAPLMTLDLRPLLFMNSSGIGTLSKFVLSLRDNSDLQLAILGSYETPWQRKSLKNFQRFLPSLNLSIE